MKGGYSDSWILYSGFSISLFRGVWFKPDTEIELFGIFETISILFFFIKQAILIRTDKYGYGRKLFRLKSHSLATMGEILLPGDIVIFAFMTIYPRSFHGYTICFDSFKTCLSPLFRQHYLM